jgi:hypothetical protein
MTVTIQNARGGAGVVQIGNEGSVEVEASFGSGAAAPPSFISKSEQTRGSGSNANITVTAPASIADADVLYLAVWGGNSGAAASTCSGFSQIYFDNAAIPSLTILKKTAASESGNYTVANTTTQRLLAEMLVYRGGSATEDVIGTIARATSATQTGSTINALSSGVLLFFSAAGSTSVTISTPPGGMTQRAATVSSGNYNGATYELTPSAAGATGAKSIVYSASQAGGAILMQIK